VLDFEDREPVAVTRSSVTSGVKRLAMFFARLAAVLCGLRG